MNGVYGAGVYARGSLDGDSTGSGTQGVVYDTQTLQLVGEAAIGTASTAGQPRKTLRYRLRPVGQTAASDFYVYNSHAKSADDSASASRRLVEANAIRADADALGDGVTVLYVGDFNSDRSSEAGYQRFFGAGAGQAFDPINAPGSWHENAAFRAVFTQAPSANPPSGLTGGGLDDRFDFILTSDELADGAGLEYVAGSYHTFGNDGSVDLNGSINDPSSTALTGLPNRTQVLNLLTTATDHLPVVADFRLGVPRVTGVAVNAGQDNTAQRSRVTSVTVAFDSRVTFVQPANVAAAFGLSRIEGGSVGGFSATANTVGGVTTVTLSGFTGAEAEFGSLADGRYTVVVRANQIAGGLDGNGDGTAGDDYTLAGTVANGLFRLYGDANGDGSVSGSDFGLLRLAFGTSTGDPNYLSFLDFDGNGSISGTDFGNFRLRFGTTLP